MTNHISRRGALKASAASILGTVGLSSVPAAVGADSSSPNYGEPATVTSSRGPNYGALDGYDDVVEEADADYIVETLSEFLDALDVAEYGDVVYVPGDVEINLGTDQFIDIPEGVTLASNRGVNGSRGGLIYRDTVLDGWPQDSWSLLAHSDVRVTGLRIRGRYWDWGPVPRYGDDAPHDGYVGGKGLLIWNGDWGIEPGTITNVEVDNCEFSGWGAGCVTAYTGSDNCRIHHNDFHDSLIQGLGYGVSVGGGYHEIDHNTFNRFRHSVTSSGDPTTGYDVHHNVFGDYAMGAVIDMHCDGGNRMDVHNNTIRAVERRNPFRGEKNAVGVIIRCVPDDEAWIHQNWFYNPLEPLDEPDMWTEEAIVQVHVDEWTNVRYEFNQYGDEEPEMKSIGAPHADKVQW